MPCLHYGKLPARRDFVAGPVPRPLLSLWEEWLQAGISASRTQLGARWQQAFLEAPLWRFHLGAALAGGTVAGAFMPCVDGVGRYFPLSVFALAPAGAAYAPPELDPRDEWFERVEEVLLGALEPQATYEAFTRAVGDLPDPEPWRPEAPPGAVRLPGDALALCPAPPGTDAFRALRLAGPERFDAAASLWWTRGGEGFPPCAIAARGMPDPYVFTAMLTGRFDHA